MRPCAINWVKVLEVFYPTFFQNLKCSPQAIFMLMTGWNSFIFLPTLNVPAADFLEKLIGGVKHRQFLLPLVSQVVNLLGILMLLPSPPSLCSNPELLSFLSELIELWTSKEGIKTESLSEDLMWWWDGTMTVIQARKSLNVVTSEKSRMWQEI